MQIADLEGLFLDEIRDLYSAETQLSMALPRMIQAAGSDAVKAGLRTRLDQSPARIKRIERICSGLGSSADGKFCRGMDGLIKEEEELLTHSADRWVRDAGLISSAQRMEHYEIACCGTARAYAMELGYSEAAGLLKTSLDEENAADRKLTQIALDNVNREAAHATA